MKKSKENEGFAALITTIVISSILVMSVISFGENAAELLFHLGLTEAKIQSFLAADSCANIALLHLVEQNPMVFPKTIEIGDSTCSITSISITNASGSNIVTIKTQSVVRNSFTYLESKI